MARLRRFLIAAVAVVAGLLLPLAASAQSNLPVDAKVIPGNNFPAGTNGCPSTYNCFVPYSSSSPLPVGIAPATSGGLSVYSAIVPNNTTSTVVKAGAGQLYGAQVFNNNSTIAYLKLYNAAQGSTTCGSGTPIARYMIPALSGFVYSEPNGLAFSTAITACVTTGIADNDTTAPAASTYLVNVTYK